MSKDIVEHINENVLLIPEQLKNFDNVKVLFSNKHNGAYLRIGVL